jgi:hypothetical protein
MDKIFEELIKKYPNDMELGKAIRKSFIEKQIKKDSKTPKIKSNGVQ